MEIIKTLESKNIELVTEVEIVKLLLKDEKFTATYSKHLSPSLFREQLRSIVEVTLTHWKQYGKLVTMEVLLQELRFKIGSNLTQEKFNAILQVLQRLQQDPRSPEYVTDQVANFIRFQRTENALIQGIKTLSEAEKNKDPEKLRDIVSLISRANEDFNIQKPSYWLEGIESRTARRELIERGEIDTTGFGTGIPEVDELIPITFGIKPGEIGFWVGATGRGKSIALMWCALFAALKGFNVAYISLELTEESLLNRADASVSKTEISDIVKDREHVKQYIEGLKTDFSIPLAEIAFRELPCAGTTVLDIRNEIIRMQQIDDFHPQLLIVDYIDLLMPIRKTKEGGWKEQQVVTQELRGFGGEFGLGVWTASQGNRGAAHKNEEGEMLGDADVAESYSKLGVADLVITINRTKTQMSMPEPRPAYLFIAKNRNGIAGRKIGILTDFGKMSFYEGPYEQIPNADEMEQLAMESGAIKRKRK